MATFADICAVLGRHYSASSARTIARMAVRRIGAREHTISTLRDHDALLLELRRGMDLFAASATARRLCVRQLEALFDREGGEESVEVQDFEVAIVDESHIVEARTKARSMAAEIGFGRTQQVKVATVVSELARNIYHYAGTGVIAARRIDGARPGVVIEARDEGPGIADVESILAGAYRSRTGLGLGLIGCKNLSDELTIDTAPGEGTRVKVKMYR
ncbi:MAG: anti-sigma regulatory factor [Nannocystaceae bacterium]